MPDRAGVTSSDEGSLQSSAGPVFPGGSLPRRDASKDLAILALYALTLAIAAFLLFVVQPMAGKAVLPTLGGTPAVWTTCMAFFQTALLAGYAYAHLLSAPWGTPRRQAMIHLAMLGIAALVAHRVGLLDQISAGPPEAQAPVAWLLGLLIATIGFPFVVLSATAPMLQRWYAHGGFRSSSDPYFLYASSNLGSLLALVAYPVLIEPLWPLEQQARFWWIGFSLLFILTTACAVVTRPTGTAGERSGVDLEPPGSQPRWLSLRRWGRWAVLAFIPSCSLVGVTAYLSTDVAAMPLLWVIPLGLYLLSLISAFARRPMPPRAWSIRAFPVLALLLAPALAAGLVQPFWIPLHLATFFFGALVCHGELVRDRPSTRGLTAFYLALAFGGAAGGLFNALVAPWVFDRIAEYPLALVLALLVVPSTGSAVAGRHSEQETALARRTIGIPLAVLVLGSVLAVNPGGLATSVVGVFALMIAAGLVALSISTLRSRPRRFALTLGAILLASGLSSGVDGRTLLRERNFYGVLRVTHDEPAQMRRLFHGSTLHGQQSTRPDAEGIPLSYFHPSGPIGDVFEAVAMRAAPGEVAVVGLGIGSLAAYSRPGERWTFYEIDPSVERVASDPRYFSYLEDAQADHIRIRIGDARLRLADAPDGAYTLIVLDAFSSDALPVHLMTREALQVYRRKLVPGGLLAFNLSNRYLDLNPVLGSLARDAGMACRIRSEFEVDASLRRQGKLPSIWGVLAENEADLGLLASDHRWKPARTMSGGRVWTDQWSSLIAAWRRPWSTRSPEPASPAEP